MKEEIKKVAGTEVAFEVPTVESIGKLKKLEPKFSLTMKYKTADEWAELKDKEVRAFFMGLKEIPNDDGELVTCGVFMNEQEVFLSGQMILVDAIKNLQPKTPIAIIYRGKKKNKASSGTTMMFDITTLG